MDLSGNAFLIYTEHLALTSATVCFLITMAFNTMGKKSDLFMPYEQILQRFPDILLNIEHEENINVKTKVYQIGINI